jgi:hypothetical protein
MDNSLVEKERRKQARLEKLGTNNPICGTCGITDWRQMQLHHIAGQKHDETLVILCANDHCIVTDDQKDHPSHDPAADPLLSQIGHFLLGLADILKLVVAKLVEFGQALIERSNPDCSKPVA